MKPMTAYPKFSVPVNHKAEMLPDEYLAILAPYEGLTEEQIREQISANLTEIQGVSEKQIRYAADLRERTIDGIARWIREMLMFRPALILRREMRKVAAVTTETSAREIIDALKY